MDAPGPSAQPPAGAGGIPGALLAWLGWWLAGAALWLALVDNTPLPELIAGAVAAAIGATAATAVRSERIAVLRPDPRWLLRAWRPFRRVPRDLWLLTALLARRLITRRHEPGRLLAVPFAFGDGSPRDVARRALAEGLGSVSPNLYVVDVDQERDLLLVHQLAATRHPARDADPLELG